MASWDARAPVAFRASPAGKEVDEEVPAIEDEAMACEVAGRSESHISDQAGVQKAGAKIEEGAHLEMGAECPPVVDVEDLRVKAREVAQPNSKKVSKCKALVVMTVVMAVLGLSAAISYFFFFHESDSHEESDVAEDETVLHVSGHAVDDAETSTLIEEMSHGRESFSIMIADDMHNLTWGHFSMNVTRFVSELPNFTYMSAKAAVLLNEDEEGIVIGGHRFKAVVCEQEGPAHRNCEFVEDLPANHSGGDGRALLDDNEMAVYVTGIVVLGAVAVACMAMCSSAIAVAAGGVTVTAGAGCFPSNAMVHALGGVQAIKSVSIGALLLTSQGYAPVFLNSHQDGAALSQMVRLVTASNHSLTLTADHYLPMAGGLHVSAGHVSVGDQLLVQTDDGFAPSAVTAVDMVLEQGLWNPFTTTGDLVVNGVLASSHSSWFLEGTSLSEDRVVNIYKTLLTPLGYLYWVAPGWFSRFSAAYKNDNRPLSELSATEIVKTAGATLLQV